MRSAGSTDDCSSVASWRTYSSSAPMGTFTHGLDCSRFASAATCSHATPRSFWHCVWLLGSVRSAHDVIRLPFIDAQSMKRIDCRPLFSHSAIHAGFHGSAASSASLKRDGKKRKLRGGLDGSTELILSVQ